MINPKEIAAQRFRAVTPQETGSMCWTGSISADCPYFEGHFPGNPTLPAVAMMDLSLEFVRQCTGYGQAKIANLKSAKFTAPVGADMDLEVRLTLGTDGQVEAVWSLLGGSGGVAARFFFSVLT